MGALDPPLAGVAAVAAQMCVALARLLRDGETVFHGVASPLPMVAVLLARRLHAPGLVYLTLPGGIDPLPSVLPCSTADAALLEGSRARWTLADVFDLSARGRLDVVFLSGAQIDRQGRLNLSVIGEFAHPRVRLPGGAGSAMLLPSARRAILWRGRHDPRCFVERVDFATAVGNVDRVVTPLCVFRRGPAGLEVESIHPGVDPADLRERTGFPLALPPGVPRTPPPTPAELEALAALDPHGVATLELR